MFMNVITGYFSTFKVIQGHIFESRSYQGQTNSKNVCSVIYHQYAKYKKISPMAIEISLERSYFEVSSLEAFGRFRHDKLSYCRS